MGNGQRSRGFLREVTLVVLASLLSAGLTAIASNWFADKRMLDETQMALMTDAVSDYANAWATRAKEVNESRFAAKIRIAAFGSKDVAEALCGFEGTLVSKKRTGDWDDQDRALTDLVASMRAGLSLERIDEGTLTALVAGGCAEVSSESRAN